MRNLWNRLSEENRLKLENQRTLYPAIGKALIEELQQTFTYTDLKFESIIFLVQELTDDNKGWVILIDDLFSYEKI